MKFLLLLAAVLTCTKAGIWNPIQNLNKNFEMDPLPPGVEQHYFKQKLDHFNRSDQRTFQQRYFLNSQFHQQSGPIFLVVGGSGPIYGYELSYENGTGQNWMVNANRFGAFCFCLEHRYYGDSNATVDATLPNLVWLTIEQALADIANFITTMNKEREFHTAKWILFGCSYGGALVAHFRLKYPDLAVGAVASSPPLVAKVNCWEYLAVVRNTIAKHNCSCLRNIAHATAEIQTRVMRNDRIVELEAMFQMCSPCGFPDAWNLAVLLFNLFRFVSDVVQNNHINSGVHDDLLTISRMCGLITFAGGDPLSNYANAVRFILYHMRQPCLPCNYPRLVDNLRRTRAAGRLVQYQRAMQLGLCRTSDLRNHNPFSHFFPIEFHSRMYSDIFGITSKAMEANVIATNERYGGKNLTATNVVIVNGMDDPWKPFSVVHHPPAGVVVVNIRGGSHCSEIYSPRAQERQELVQARATITAEIERWLAQ